MTTRGIFRTETRELAWERRNLSTAHCSASKKNCLQLCIVREKNSPACTWFLQTLAPECHVFPTNVDDSKDSLYWWFHCVGYKILKPFNYIVWSTHRKQLHRTQMQCSLPGPFSRAAPFCHHCLTLMWEGNQLMWSQIRPKPHPLALP